MHPALGGRPAGTGCGHRPGPEACSLPGAGWGVGVSGREELPRVRVEFVTMGGPEGQALEERQLAVIKEILAWLHQHPASISQHDQKAA
jgi:hypothetical protein